ncbi:MAG: Fungalysin metallopeptidase-domain-containing protein [Piptocephalis tieghemiana]|nr:MAG: Fungalysin metallopeptidase-domain-containing protein [Piptocephalis tieghemiana]
MITPVEAVIALANYLHIPAPRAIDLTPSVSDQMTSAGTTTTITNVSYAADLTAKVTTSLYFDKSGSLTRTHRIQVRLDGNYLNAQISAEDGSILSLVDWVFSAGKFLVYGWGGPNDPSEGAPVLRGEDTRGITQFSPYGWVDPQSKRRWNVAGNNVDVRDGRKGALETDMGTLVPGYEDGVMAYQPGSLNQAASSIFFHGNMMHDFLGVYDFTVENGAFQKRNYGKGGREGGSIVILVNSDITERENPDIARFWAPPSPEPGIMELGVLQGRSAALTFDIPTHEYFHGVSSRSTGGATNADCLCGSRESEMLSEGWSDLMSVILRVTPKHTRRTAKFGFAEYVMGKNLRGRKYSAAPKDPKDPYSSIRGRTTHMGGAVWAGVLYDIFWNLVDRLGFDPDWMSGSTERGNTLTLWIIMVGMRLQPCLPTFLNARDAILQATEIIQPTVLCDVWRAFAARGLGVDSRLIQGNITATDAEVPLQPVDGFSLPAQCKDSKAAPIRQ